MTTYALVGHQKCGTRWLTTILRDCDKIVFINSTDLKKHRSNGDTDFFTRYSGINVPVLIDATTSIPEVEHCEFLKKLDPDMEAILIYREPVSALVSMHHYQYGSYQSRKLLVAGKNIDARAHHNNSELFQSLMEGTLKELYELQLSYLHTSHVIVVTLLGVRADTVVRTRSHVEIPHSES